MDLYFRSGYAHQIDNRTCTAASVAMMLNFTARHDLNLYQMSILRYEQTHDVLNDAIQRGSDALGWSRALTYFSTKSGKGSFVYNWKAYNSEYEALKRAAKQIAITHKPVGLAIWHGGHAVVMTGFEATGDPRKGSFKLTHVWISDPYGAHHRRFTAKGSPLDIYLQRDATRKFNRAWYGKFVIVIPRTPTPTPTPTPDPTPSPTPTPTPAPTPSPTRSPTPTSGPPSPPPVPTVAPSPED